MYRHFASLKVRICLGSARTADPSGGPGGGASFIRRPWPGRWVAEDSFGLLEMALDDCQVVCKILKCLKQYSLYNVIKY